MTVRGNVLKHHWHRPQCPKQSPQSHWKQRITTTQSKDSKLGSEGQPINKQPVELWRRLHQVKEPGRNVPWNVKDSRWIRGLLSIKGRPQEIPHTSLPSYPYLSPLWRIFSKYRHTALLCSGDFQAAVRRSSHLILQSVSCWSVILVPFVVTKYHKLGSFKQQKFIPSPFWRPDGWNQGISRAIFPTWAQGRILPCLL